MKKKWKYQPSATSYIFIIEAYTEITILKETVSSKYKISKKKMKKWKKRNIPTFHTFNILKSLNYHSEKPFSPFLKNKKISKKKKSDLIDLFWICENEFF